MAENKKDIINNQPNTTPVTIPIVVPVVVPPLKHVDLPKQVDLNKIKQEITIKHFENIGMCLQALCNKCGGRTITKCACAQTKYANSITQQMINRYNEKKGSINDKLLMKYVNTGKI